MKLSGFLLKISLLVMIMGIFCPAVVAGKISVTKKQYNPFARYQKNIKGIDARIKAEKKTRNPREAWIENLEKRKQNQQELIEKKLKVELVILQKKLKAYTDRLSKKTASGYSSKKYDARIKKLESKIANLKKVAGQTATQKVESELELAAEKSAEEVTAQDE
ncbi:MAG: hypothetical protein L3J71_10690 [Victivallaceae bacterium]|nr:hypothetical protein [Victivallaceae bacterium]